MRRQGDEERRRRNQKCKKRRHRRKTKAIKREFANAVNVGSGELDTKA